MKTEGVCVKLGQPAAELPASKCEKGQTNKRYERWNWAENRDYVNFLRRHEPMFNDPVGRRSAAIYNKMATELANGRNNHQCRSHHMKMLKKYSTLQGIIANILSLEKSGQKTKINCRPDSQAFSQSPSMDSVREKTNKNKREADSSFQWDDRAANSFMEIFMNQCNQVSKALFSQPGKAEQEWKGENAKYVKKETMTQLIPEHKDQPDSVFIWSNSKASAFNLVPK